MATEKTLAMIKPDALQKGNQGKIIDRILENGFKILAMKQVQLTRGQAEAFYREHAERPFFNDLCEFMVSGPIIALAMEKENGIADWRDLMGATNPAEAAEGTIRKDFADSIDANAVHGSDSPGAAHREVPFFFNHLEY